MGEVGLSLSCSFLKNQSRRRKPKIDVLLRVSVPEPQLHCPRYAKTIRQFLQAMHHIDMGDASGMRVIGRFDPEEVRRSLSTNLGRVVEVVSEEVHALVVWKKDIEYGGPIGTVETVSGGHRKMIRHDRAAAAAVPAGGAGGGPQPEQGAEPFRVNAPYTFPPPTTTYGMYPEDDPSGCGDCHIM